MLNKLTQNSQLVKLFQSTLFFNSQADTPVAEQAAIVDTPAPKKANIEVTQLNGASPVTLLKLNGPLNVKNYRDVIDAAKTAVDTGTQCIIFDMSNVPSLGLTSMVALHSIATLLKGEEPLNLEHDGHALLRDISHDIKTSDKQHNLKLLNPQPQVKAQLDQSGFTDYLDVCTDFVAAIEKNGIQFNSSITRPALLP